MSLGYRDYTYRENTMDLSNLLSGVKPEENMQSGALPTGNYDVVVEKIEPKETKTGGKALNFQLRVFGPTHANAVLFDWVNIDLPSSPKATEIGKARLKKIAELCGSADTTKMVGQRMSVFATVEKSEQYGDQNRVKAYNEFVAGNAPAGEIKSNTSFNSDDIPF